MDIVNYLCNRLLIRSNSVIVIFKKTWKNTRQNLEHIQILESRVNTFIFSEKCTKSDV